MKTTGSGDKRDAAGNERSAQKRHPDSPGVEHVLGVNEGDTREKLAAILGKDPAELKGQFSGGPLGIDFKRGWAVLPFIGQKAHWYWRGVPSAHVATLQDGSKTLLVTTPVSSACGIEGRERSAVPLLGPGTVDRCARCVGMATKQRWG